MTVRFLYRVLICFLVLLTFAAAASPFRTWAKNDALAAYSAMDAKRGNKERGFSTAEASPSPRTDVIDRAGAERTYADKGAISFRTRAMPHPMAVSPSISDLAVRSHRTPEPGFVLVSALLMLCLLGPILRRLYRVKQ